MSTFLNNQRGDFDGAEAGSGTGTRRVNDAPGALQSTWFRVIGSGCPWRRKGGIFDSTLDQRNQHTKIEFYSFPGNGTAMLSKSVVYTYDVNVARVSDAGLSPGSNRISNTLTVPGYRSQPARLLNVSMR